MKNNRTTTSESSENTNQAENSAKPSGKRNLGFYKRRRGILEHLESGTISLLDSGIHDFLCLKANSIVGSDYPLPPGVCKTSAAAIRAMCPRGTSEREIRRSLEHLEEIGWIKRWIVQGKRGNYPVLVCRLSVRDLAGNEYRVSGEKTIDWRNPVLEPVGDSAVKAPRKRRESAASKEVKELGRVKERKVSRDRRRLSLSGKVWEELKIKTLPSRHRGFVEVVEATSRGESEDFVAWCRRIMDQCDARGTGYRYPTIFYKHFKNAERDEARKAVNAFASNGERYSVPEAIYVQA